MQDGVTVIDLNDVVCDERRCHAFVGGIPVDSDENHLMHQFARTLAPLLDDELATVVPLGSGQGR